MTFKEAVMASPRAAARWIEKDGDEPIIYPWNGRPLSSLPEGDDGRCYEPYTGDMDFPVVHAEHPPGYGGCNIDGAHPASECRALTEAWYR